MTIEITVTSLPCGKDSIIISEEHLDLETCTIKQLKELAVKHVVNLIKNYDETKSYGNVESYVKDINRWVIESNKDTKDSDIYIEFYDTYRE